MAERSRSDTIQLKARMKEPLRAKLEAAAEARGVSLNAEMVHRLEQSFTEDFGSESNRILMRALTLANKMAEITTGKDVFSDRETAQAARTAMIAILDALLPIEPLAPKDKIEPSEGQRLILADPEARSLGDNIRDAILEGLGPSLPAIKSSLKRKS